MQTFLYECKINAMEETKKTYDELKDKYDELNADYVAKYFALKDKYKKEQAELREQYLFDRLMVEKPLKAEKYKLKTEKRKRNRALNEPPKRSLLEEIGNSVTHGVGALIGITALVLMIIKSDSPFKLAAGIIFGICFFLQMLFSCLYHSFRSGTTVKRIFRRFDYSSIYLQIGGTFAPIYLVYTVGLWGFGVALTLFIVQWVLIATGITFVGVFGPGRFRWLHFTLYFVLGWFGLIYIPFWISSGDIALLLWILSGGIVYTLGMIPFALLKGKPVAHFIWHFVVLIGAILMWMGIYLNIF